MNLARGKTVMTTEQQRKILEAAAKVCGVYLLWHERWGCFYDYNKRHESKDFQEWNPLDNPADCAEMCAKLEISHAWRYCQVRATNRIVLHDEPHDGTPEGRLKAWMYAATMVAAKTQGYEE